MTSLLQFEEKVHRRDLTRAESIPFLIPRLLSYVLEQMGFPEEPGIEMRDSCLQVVAVDRIMTMPVHFHIRQRDQEEVPGQEQPSMQHMTKDWLELRPLWGSAIPCFIRS